ncbi:hypothetical protein BV25DRAFT_1791136 [Artomyces pyxidatus]|uniref:Uncharacterized protein n=1 Tax=Artomyces pyxidatus TaxID=48021 RepID=A0ACB8TKY6_9AGAM|nr:hypothetical protein BV25DRAFT_1791136 [Artomyces pyxidatus]
MEKYSAYRDPGTGIQPFLPLIPPSGSNVWAKVALPLAYAIGALRTALILILALLYLVVIEGVCLVLVPIPILHKAVTYVFTALLSRLTLLVLGLWWIPVELIARKRIRAGTQKESWNPRAGDLIISNWASWIEVLWLAFRFNPVFVLPISAPVTPASAPTSEPITHTSGRRTGTGSAAISSPATRPIVRRVPILGFRRVTLLSMIRSTAQVPPFETDTAAGTYSSLEDIRSAANRPVVVFPECTSTNGRALLRFANIFEGRAVPVKGFKVFLMCVRYDLPTATLPTLTHCIATNLNPLTQVFGAAATLKPLTMSIRLLVPSESPSSPTFMASEVVSGDVGADTLSAACAGLIAQLGKFKKMNLGWEDKVSFLELYREKSR